MTLRTDLTPLGTLRDTLRAGFGMARYSVTVRTETFAAAIADGLAAPATAEVDILPAPPVVKLTGEAAAWHGSDPLAATTGRLERLVFRIGPIPLKHATGGFDSTDLRPEPTGPTERLVYWIVGPDVPDGAAFELTGQAGCYTEGPFGTTLVVRQAAPVEAA